MLDIVIFLSILKNRIKNAKFPQIKDLDTFDFGESSEKFAIRQ